MEVRERKKYPNMWGTLDLRPKREQKMFFSLTSRPGGLMQQTSRPMFTNIRATQLRPISVIPKNRRIEQPPIQQEEQYVQDEYTTPPQEQEPEISDILSTYYNSPEGQQRAQQIAQRFPQYNQTAEQHEQATVFMLEGLVDFYKRQGKTIPTTLYEDLYSGIYEGLQ